MADQEARHNVLLLTVDTWRADRMSLYGYDRPTTPALDRFAESTIVCDNAYALGPFTQIACVPLFTSTSRSSSTGRGSATNDPLARTSSLGSRRRPRTRSPATA